MPSAWFNRLMLFFAGALGAGGVAAAAASAHAGGAHLHTPVVDERHSDVRRGPGLSPSGDCPTSA
jgi:hypothetical protein